MTKQPDIIDMIEQRRASLGWTQAELARRCGWSAPRLANYLTRQKSPSITTIQPVLNALGMTGIEWTPPPSCN